MPSLRKAVATNIIRFSKELVTGKLVDQYVADTTITIVNIGVIEQQRGNAEYTKNANQL